jgi:hypothetical protein
LRLVPGGFEGRNKFKHADESRAATVERQIRQKFIAGSENLPFAHIRGSVIACSG